MRLAIPCTGLSVLLASATTLAQTAPAPMPAASPAPLAVAAAPAAPAPAMPLAEAPPAPSPPPPPAPEPEPSEWKLALHGFVGASFYVQDSPAFVLNGQGPLLALAQPGGGITTGADIRQSRFNFSVTGPKVLEGVPKAVLEIDLFGLNSPGGYGEVSVYSRVRLAYAELSWGNDVLRVGQDHELILAMTPESMGHIAYLSTYFNGQLGWREPGAGYYHTIPIDTSKLELAVQVNKADWQNPADFGTASTQDLNVDYGQLSGLPAVEARVKFTSENVTAFLAGHYNRVAGSKAAELVIQPTAPAANPTRDWDVMAGVAGIKVKGGGFSLAVSGYAGKNLGPLLGEELQFFTTNDVREWGGWAQAMYRFTKHFDLSMVGGLARLNTADVAANGGGRAESSMVGGMARFQSSGFAFGPEYFHIIDKNIDKNGNGAASGPQATGGVIDANQGLLTAQYTF